MDLVKGVLIHKQSRIDSDIAITVTNWNHQLNEIIYQSVLIVPAIAGELYSLTD